MVVKKIGSISKVIGNKKLRRALYKGALVVVCQLEKRESRSQKERLKKVRPTFKRLLGAEVYKTVKQKIHEGAKISEARGSTSI